MGLLWYAASVKYDDVIIGDGGYVMYIEKERSGHKLFELWRKAELIDKTSEKRCTSAVKRKR